MLRHAYSALRSVSGIPGVVGLHTGMITMMVQSLGDFHTLSNTLIDNIGTLQSKPERRNYSQSHMRYAAHMPTTQLRRASGGGGGGGGGAAESFDLTPPDVGTIRIDGYDETGFIVGDVQVEGSILCCGDLWLTWKPRSMSEITIESLALVDLVKPAPDIVVLGTGRRIQQVPPALLKALEERNVAVEAVDTMNAASTFNILNQEGRKVVGALLPAGADS